MGDFTPTLPFCLGTPVVLAATFMYGRPESELNAEQSRLAIETQISSLEEHLQEARGLLEARDAEIDRLQAASPPPSPLDRA